MNKKITTNLHNILNKKLLNYNRFNKIFIRKEIIPEIIYEDPVIIIDTFKEFDYIKHTNIKKLKCFEFLIGLSLNTRFIVYTSRFYVYYRFKKFLLIKDKIVNFNSLNKFFLGTGFKTQVKHNKIKRNKNLIVVGQQKAGYTCYFYGFLGFLPLNQMSSRYAPFLSKFKNLFLKNKFFYRINLIKSFFNVHFSIYSQKYLQNSLNMLNMLIFKKFFIFLKIKNFKLYNFKLRSKINDFLKFIFNTFIVKIILQKLKKNINKFLTRNRFSYRKQAKFFIRKERIKRVIHFRKAIKFYYKKKVSFLFYFFIKLFLYQIRFSFKLFYPKTKLLFMDTYSFGKKYYIYNFKMVPYPGSPRFPVKRKKFKHNINFIFFLTKKEKKKKEKIIQLKTQESSLVLQPSGIKKL